MGPACGYNIDGQQKGCYFFHYTWHFWVSWAPNKTMQIFAPNYIGPTHVLK